MDLDAFDQFAQDPQNPRIFESLGLGYNAIKHLSAGELTATALQLHTSLANIFHPDKNQGFRSEYEKVIKASQLLRDTSITEVAQYRRDFLAENDGQSQYYRSLSTAEKVALAELSLNQYIGEALLVHSKIQVENIPKTLTLFDSARGIFAETGGYSETEKYNIERRCFDNVRSGIADSVDTKELNRLLRRFKKEVSLTHDGNLFLVDDRAAKPSIFLGRFSLSDTLNEFVRFNTPSHGLTIPWADFYPYMHYLNFDFIEGRVKPHDHSYLASLITNDKSELLVKIHGRIEFSKFEGDS